ncbi:protein angel homolog 1 isoform X1 [Alosa sapidissima]|uniref:protein angel homolog 1 isoform X1 n=2 Tax=Alosa sapidissima TaxID=34773 RepID=UPI001C083D88|nr:protein angel homolog 1 isoform X1 [Alosa sapidissima]
MLGSVLFYALYPLTLVVIKVSESLVKAASSVLMNGKEAWDTGGPRPQKLAKCQSAVLDEWLGPSGLIHKNSEKTIGDDESKCLEEMQEEIMEKKATPVASGCIPCPTDEDIFWEIQNEGIGPETEAKVQEGVVQSKSHMLNTDMVEGDASQEDVELKGEGIGPETEAKVQEGVVQPKSHVLSSNMAEGGASQEEGIGPETEAKVQEGVVQPKSHVLSSNKAEGDASQEDVEMKEEGIRPAIEAKVQEGVVQPKSHMLAEGDASQEDIKREDGGMTPPVAQGGESASTNDNQDTGVEAYVAQADLETHPHTGSSDPQGCPITDCLVMDLGALLAETQTCDSLPQFKTESQPEMDGWHFPVGHGLADMAHRPYWQFPAMSYYPALQENTEFKVMWRVWEDLPGPQAEAAVPQMIDQDPDTLFKFSVMSYNILAQDLLEANPDLYLHCSDKVLVWSARLKGIIQEIQAWRPDILCLQEAQEDHFKKQLQPVLSDMGYSCVYKRRTGSKTDGCAVCYQNKRFSQLSVSLLELRKERCELLDRDNVAIVLLLQPITSQCHDERGTPICVATTHLLFNPRRGDIKLAQLVLVLAEVDKVVKRCKIMGRDCEVVLCGDFNSLPNMPLYQFISTGQLHYHGLPAWMISGQEDLSHQTHPRRVLAPLLPSSLGINDNCQYVTTSMAKPPPPGELKYNHDYMLNLRYSQAACVRPKDLEHIPGVTDNAPDQHEKQPCALTFRNTICHCLNLNSAYSHIITGTDRPEVTTVHSSAGATVDYIFYTARSEHSRSQTDKGARGGLELIGRLSLLSEADLWSLRGLPNEIFTSDHLSLLVKFQLRISPL